MIKEKSIFHECWDERTTFKFNMFNLESTKEPTRGHQLRNAVPAAQARQSSRCPSHIEKIK
jgi:hypothetical protein